MNANDRLVLTADIVSAYLSNNEIVAADLPELIAAVQDALAATGPHLAVPIAPRGPAVSIRSSVKPDHLICLEDGTKRKMLKRHLREAHAMSPAEYRAKWGLPRAYPMVAPAYAEARRELAQSSGLGRKKAVETGVAVDVAPLLVAEQPMSVATLTPRKRLGIAAAKAAARAHLGDSADE